MIKLQLPLPAKELSPNSRGDRRKKAGIVAAARNEGYLLGKAAKWQSKLTISDRLQVTLQVTWPNNIRRDLDNVLASNKAALDGVFVGLGVDDSQVDKFIVDRMPVSKKNAGIVLIIERL